MKGVVLAGGVASRLYPLTTVLNKHLLPVYNQPMIYYPIQALARMGVTEILIILGGKSVGDIVNLLQDGSDFGIDLTYRYQNGAYGIAHAISLAEDFVGGDSFCCILGDNILLGEDLEATARSFDESAWEAKSLLFEVSNPEKFGVAEFSGNKIVRFEEKPEAPKSNYIPIGVYFLRAGVFKIIETLVPSGRGEFEITDILNHYIGDGSLDVEIYEGLWMDAGTTQSLLAASNIVEEWI